MTEGVNEKEIVGILKPEQVPQLKNGEQLPSQSLSCWLSLDCSVLANWSLSEQLSFAQQGLIEIVKTYKASMKYKIFTVSKVLFYLQILSGNFSNLL